MNDELMFPDDDNGRALRQMLAEGENLSVPREFEFTVVFASEGAALQFALAMLRQGQKASFSEYEEDEEMPWQVTLHPYMDPTHENISLYESALESEVSTFEGALEGWGCVPQS